jgi:hypothetical protein
MQRLLFSISLFISTSFIFAAPLFWATEKCIGTDAGRIEGRKAEDCYSYERDASSTTIADLKIYTKENDPNWDYLGYDNIRLKRGVWYNSETCYGEPGNFFGEELFAVYCEDAIKFVDVIYGNGWFDDSDDYKIGKYFDGEPTDGGLEGAVLQRFESISLINITSYFTIYCSFYSDASCSEESYERFM